MPTECEHNWRLAVFSKGDVYAQTVDGCWYCTKCRETEPFAWDR